MDYSEIKEHVEQYARLVAEILHPRMIILYGSYVKGTAREESDIDIAVIYDGKEEEYWDIIKHLYQLRRGIDSRIEPILLEYGNNENGLYEDVLQTGMVLYAA